MVKRLGMVQTEGGPVPGTKYADVPGRLVQPLGAGCGSHGRGGRGGDEIEKPTQFYGLPELPARAFSAPAARLPSRRFSVVRSRIGSTGLCSKA
jgi:hypothetical protein